MHVCMYVYVYMHSQSKHKVSIALLRVIIEQVQLFEELWQLHSNDTPPLGAMLAVIVLLPRWWDVMAQWEWLGEVGT